MRDLNAFWLGRLGYQEASELMSSLATARAEGRAQDTALLLEHSHVYTLGRRGSAVDILLDTQALQDKGIEVATTDRGGLVTYHGPGQLVGYPVLDLGANASAPAYVSALERAIIKTLAGFGVTAEAIEGTRGVWVGDGKIAAIGVHLSKGITTHGFALNVNPDLSLFQGIVPCGISDKRVTSIQEITGSAPPMTLVAKRAARALALELDAQLQWPGPSALDEIRLSTSEPQSTEVAQ